MMEKKEVWRKRKVARRINQKQKILALMRLFWEETDAKAGLTMGQIIERLSAEGIDAERKSLYDDIELLRLFGFEIEMRQAAKTHSYHLSKRIFSLAELKLLTDAVQSFKLLPEEESKVLTDKLRSLTGRKEAMALSRQLVVTDRLHHRNREVYESVDLLHTAISENLQVSFQYFDWNRNKERVLRHDGARYQLSPWLLVWEEGNYYLAAYDSKRQSLRHYRVDKMTDMKLSDLAREGREAFEATRPEAYGRGMFGMFGGESTLVTLRCRNRCAGIIMERFGQEITLFPDGEDHFTVNVRVVLCNLFYAWVIGFGEEVQLLAPSQAVEALRSLAMRSLTAHTEETTK